MSRSITRQEALAICRKARKHGEDTLCPYAPYTPRWYVWKTRLKYSWSHDLVINSLVKYGVIQDDTRK